MTMTVLDAGGLRKLLGLLVTNRDYAISLEPVMLIREQDPDKPVAEALEETVAALRLVVYEDQSFEQTGLFEFDLALIYLEARRYDEATSLFERAGRQWSFTDDLPLICLVEYARGISLHLAERYEDALRGYLGVKRCLVRGASERDRSSWSARGGQLNEYFEQLGSDVDAAIKVLEGRMQRAVFDRLRSVAEAAPPIIDEAMSFDMLASGAQTSLTASFDVGDSLIIEDLRERILPVLEAIGQINDSLAAFVKAETASGLTIDRIAREELVKITLVGLFPEAAETCQRLFVDSDLQGHYARMRSELSMLRSGGDLTNQEAAEANGDQETPTAEQEERALELEAEIGKMQLAYAKELADSCAPPEATEEQKYTAAFGMLSAMQVLFEALRYQTLSFS